MKTTTLCLGLFLLVNSLICRAQPFEDSLNSLVDKLSDNLIKFENKNFIVSDFVAFEDTSATALGQYLAGILRTRLAQKMPSRIIDRRLSHELVSEEKSELNERTKSSNAKQQREGVDYSIMGTMTLVEDYDYIGLIINVIDWRKGVIVTGVTGKLPRTSAINSAIEKGKVYLGNSTTTTTPGRKLNTDRKSAVDDLFGASISPLRSSECSQNVSGNTIFFGQICFENQTGEDMIFICTEAGIGIWLGDYPVTVSDGAANCSPLIPVNWGSSGGANNNATKQASFIFYSTDKKRRAKRIYTIEKCVAKSIVLTKRDLVLLND